MDPLIYEALDLFIWTSIVFLLLAIFLGVFARKPLMDGLSKREKSIRDALEESKRVREEAERMKSEFDAEKAKRAQEIEEMMAEAKRDAERLHDELKSKAEDEIRLERERLQREISTARDQALNEIWNQAVMMATDVSLQSTKQALTEDDQRKLLDDSLASVSKARTERNAQMQQYARDYVRQGGSPEVN